MLVQPGLHDHLCRTFCWNFLHNGIGNVQNYLMAVTKSVNILTTLWNAVYSFIMVVFWLVFVRKTQPHYGSQPSIDPVCKIIRHSPFPLRYFHPDSSWTTQSFSGAVCQLSHISSRNISTLLWCIWQRYLCYCLHLPLKTLVLCSVLSILSRVGYFYKCLFYELSVWLQPFDANCSISFDWTFEFTFAFQLFWHCLWGCLS